MTGTSPRLRSWVALQTFPEIVFWQRGGWRVISRADCLDWLRRDRSCQPRIAGRAFDAMSYKRGGNEFD